MKKEELEYIKGIKEQRDLMFEEGITSDHLLMMILKRLDTIVYVQELDYQNKNFSKKWYKFWK
jgi:hypothetical protein